MDLKFYFEFHNWIFVILKAKSTSLVSLSPDRRKVFQNVAICCDWLLKNCSPITLEKESGRKWTAQRDENERSLQ